MANDVASFDAVVFLHALVWDVAQKNDAVSRLGIDDYVFLGLAPRFELLAVHRVEVFRLEGVSVLDELEMGDSRTVVLEVKSGVHTDRWYCEAILVGATFFLPVTIEVQMPFLMIRSRIDVCSKAS